jgi:hypothetical protein
MQQMARHAMQTNANELGQIGKPRKENNRDQNSNGYRSIPRYRSRGCGAARSRRLLRSCELALFALEAERYDDGGPRSLSKFTRNALGHEQFTSIDRLENNGLDLTGAFHSDEWDDFRTYFRFHLSPAGKIKRLDIAQAT